MNDFKQTRRFAVVEDLRIGASVYPSCIDDQEWRVEDILACDDEQVTSYALISRATSAYENTRCCEIVKVSWLTVRVEEQPNEPTQSD